MLPPTPRTPLELVLTIILVCTGYSAGTPGPITAILNRPKAVGMVMVMVGLIGIAALTWWHHETPLTMLLALTTATLFVWFIHERSARSVGTRWPAVIGFSSASTLFLAASAAFLGM